MALADLRNPDSVRRAIAEFDQLGRDVFLSRYGFGKAREYFLEHEGKRYDSKAILGVAHGYEFPNLGPLRGRDFSGGEATVAAKARSLGFTIAAAEATNHVRELRLFHTYTREETHDIFEPQSIFTPQTGKWGIPGIVQVETPPGDFIFFVTLGKKERGQIYSDALSRTGVLDWDSQRRQHLRSRDIQTLININGSARSVHLFLRTRRDDPYTYFGPLQYIWHDPATSNPVHFRWHVVHWDARVAEQIGVKLRENPVIVPNHLTLEPPPPRVQRDPSEPNKAHQARAQWGVDYALREAKNRELGLAGEEMVVEHERSILRSSGRRDLAKDVKHIPSTVGDGVGYDVLSFTVDGKPKHIEVKTTRGGKATPFFLTAGELTAANLLGESYYLYRVFEYSDAHQSGRIFMLRPPLENQISLLPVTYRAAFVE